MANNMQAMKELQALSQITVNMVPKCFSALTASSHLTRLVLPQRRHSRSVRQQCSTCSLRAGRPLTCKK